MEQNRVQHQELMQAIQEGFQAVTKAVWGIGSLPQVTQEIAAAREGLEKLKDTEVVSDSEGPRIAALEQKEEKGVREEPEAPEDDELAEDGDVVDKDLVASTLA